MTPTDMADALSELQDLFNIYDSARIDFNTEAGVLHAKRVLHACRKFGVPAEVDALSSLYERIEKTPTTGSKMVDALIVEIQAASEGEPVQTVRADDFAGCELCHGGIVVLPLPGGKTGEVSNRAIYCDCGRGQFLWGANERKNLCLANRPDLKAKASTKRREDSARAGSNLVRFGVDPDASEAEQMRQYRESVRSMARQVGSGTATARTVQPNPPQTVDEARALLAGRKSKSTPPPQLNPEAMALAVYANGDERNEWE
ncbi:hypothetical protein GC170_14595 [bacterium]|nr:hypothetical protein [bacterium]